MTTLSIKQSLATTLLCCLTNEPLKELTPESNAELLRALSLLAAVEDGDEIVRELQNRGRLFRSKAIDCGILNRIGKSFSDDAALDERAAARITLDAQEKAALKGEVEQARKTQGYWKDEHNAANAEIAALAVERDAYKDAAERRMGERDALKAELASVKAHAEAMYADLDALRCGLGQTVSQFKSARDYRAAKEGA